MLILQILIKFDIIFRNLENLFFQEQFLTKSCGLYLYLVNRFNDPVTSIPAEQFYDVMMSQKKVMLNSFMGDWMERTITWQKELNKRELELSKLKMLQVPSIKSMNQQCLQNINYILAQLQKDSHITIENIINLRVNLRKIDGNESDLNEIYHELRLKIRLVLELFDILDIANSISDQSLDMAVKQTLQIMKSHDIYPIVADKEFIDGKYMESIGTVSHADLNDSWKKFQVYQVHKRGFMIRSSSEILRKAQVISVL
jgi:hypothetical protein